MRPGGRLGLQNRMRGAQRPWWVRFPCTPATHPSLLVSEEPDLAITFAARLSHYSTGVNRSKLLPRLLVALLLITSPAAAQTDSLVQLALRHTADSLQPPITPGRAFLRSLILP